MALQKVVRNMLSTGVSDSSDATAITIDSSEQVGIGETTPLGKLHIKSADSGQSAADSSADELVVEGSGDSGIQILSGTSNNSTILFGDSGDSAAGRFRYEHDNNALNFGTNGSWNRLYINSSGRLMIGTTTEGRANEGADMFTIGDDGSNNSGMTMRSGTSGYGSIYFSDATSGTGEYAGYVQYAHNTDQMLIATNSTTAITIDSDAKVNFTKGIEVRGDTSQSSEGGHIILRANSGGAKEFGLDVDSTNTFRIITEDDGGDANGEVRLSLSNSGSLIVKTLYGSSASNPAIKYNTTSGLIYYDTSSIRYKENVQDLPNSLDKIKALRPVSFDEKSTGDSCTGLIAEEVIEQIPDLVHLLDVEGYDTPQPNSVDYAKLSVYLLKAMQELSAKVEELENK